MEKEETKLRKSTRIPSSSYRMPSQMKTIFFGDGSSKNIPKNFSQIHSSPAIYLVHNFLSNSELEYFDTMCTHYGSKFKASFTGTDIDEEVISSERTSKFISLSKSQDKFVRDIEQKSAGLVGLSPLNVEPLQIVSYGPGQRFNLHHDAGTLLEDGSIPSMVAPRRLVTFFLYLHSLPEGCGGHTEFPRLTPPLLVRPQRNCALVFCNSTLDTNVPNPLVVHCAKPLSRHPSRCHRKLGVNIWLTDTDLGELTVAKSRTPLPKKQEEQRGAPQPAAFSGSRTTTTTTTTKKKKRKRAVDMGEEGGEGESATALPGLATSSSIDNDNDDMTNKNNSIRNKSNSSNNNNSGLGSVSGGGVLVKAERLYEQWLVASRGQGQGQESSLAHEQEQEQDDDDGDDDDDLHSIRISIGDGEEKGGRGTGNACSAGKRRKYFKNNVALTSSTSAATTSSSTSRTSAAVPCALLSLSLARAQDRLGEILASRGHPRAPPLPRHPDSDSSDRDRRDTTAGSSGPSTAFFGVTRRKEVIDDGHTHTHTHTPHTTE